MQYAHIQDDDYTKLADIAVSGNPIKEYRIPSLQRLIDAVCNHDLVSKIQTEATKLEERTLFTKPLRTENADNCTEIQLLNCIIDNASINDTAANIDLFIASIFESPIRITNCTFGQIKIIFLDMSEDIFLTSVAFLKTCSLQDLKFHGNITISKCEFYDELECSSNQFDRLILIEHCKFWGSVNFQRTNSKNTIVFKNSQFMHISYFENILAKCIRFNQCTFRNTVYLDDCNLDHLYLHRCTLHSELHATHLRCAQSSGLIGTCLKAGGYLTGSEFAGKLFLRECTAYKNLDFQGCIFGVSFDLSNLSLHNNAKLCLSKMSVRPGGRIEIPISLLSRKESHDELLHRWAQSTCSFVEWLIEYFQAIFILPIQSISKNTKKNRRSEQRVHLGLGAGPVGNLLAGESSNNPLQMKYARDTYVYLRDVFHSQPGSEDEETICAINAHDLDRRMRPWNHLSNLLPRIFLWVVQRNMVGHLLDPWRPVFTGLLLFILCGIVYSLAVSHGAIAHSDFPGDPAGAFAYWKSDPLNPFYFSITTFVTLGYGDFAPTAGWLKLAAALEGLFGVTLLALFTVSWGRKMIR